jgi:hypothetical protein
MNITIVKSQIKDSNGEIRPRYRIYDHEVTSADQVNKNDRVEFNWKSACAAAVRIALNKEATINVLNVDAEIADPDSLVNRSK